MMPAVENPSLAKIPPFLPPLDNKLKSSSEHIKNNGSCRKTKNVQTENHIHHEVADIFRLYGAEYRRTHNLSIEQHNVMYAIEHCRTSAYGFMLIYVMNAVIWKARTIHAGTGIA